MEPTIARQLASPDCYLHSLDGGAGWFVPMDRAAYHRSIFLDHRISLAEGAQFALELDGLAGVIPPAQPIGWIFHVAHCGSTLLARALEELTGALVLREPSALRQVALDADPLHLPAVLALLGRRYPEAGRTVIKANVPVNFLLEPIAAADPDAPAILLYSRHTDYLLAILRSPNHRGWVRAISTLLAGRLETHDAASDAELAAALWLAQHRRFAAALQAMPRARTLEAEQFYARPAEALTAAAALYELPGGTEAAAAIVAGPLFTTYSKNPGLAFDNAARLARRQHLVGQLASELAEATAWLARQGVDGEALVVTLDKAALLD
jgi:hypothetical protein